VKVIRHADEQVKADMVLLDPLGKLLHEPLPVRFVSEQTLLRKPTCAAVAYRQRRIPHHSADDVVNRPWELHS